MLKIAGVDEAGRGCLAGPVIAAAIILPPHIASLSQFISPTKAPQKSPTKSRAQISSQSVSQFAPQKSPTESLAQISSQSFTPFHIPELADSKILSPKKREHLFQILRQCPYGVGSASVEEIDRLNILQASLLAMQRALLSLPIKPDMVLVDGCYVPLLPPHLSCPIKPVVRGDRTEPSISAASIMAKVLRDKIMKDLHSLYPAYGWDKNKSYGTKAHKKALALYGATKHHRKSFAPVEKIL